MSLTIDAVNSLNSPLQTAPRLGLRGFSDLNPINPEADTQPTYFSATSQFPYLQQASNQSPLRTSPLQTSLAAQNQLNSLQQPNTVTNLNSSLQNPLALNSSTNVAANSNQAGQITNAPATNSISALTAAAQTQFATGVQTPNPALATNAAVPVATQATAAQVLANSQTQSELQNFGTTGGILNAFAAQAVGTTPYVTDAYSSTPAVAPIAAITAVENPIINTTA